MKVGLEARVLSMGPRGIGTYVSELITRLPDLIENLEVFTDKEGVVAGDSVSVTVVPRGRSMFSLPFWVNSSLRRAMSDANLDIAHFTKQSVPRRKIAPTITTIYDVIPLLFPESQSLSRRFYWPQTLRLAAKRSDRIITISESSKRGIVEYLGVDPSLVRVTPLGVDTSRFRPTSTKARKPYVLFVGTRDPRKNVALLVRAFARIVNDVPHDLVIVGKDALVSDGAEGEAQRLGIFDRVKFLKNVSSVDLPTWYAEADLFVWPTVYEGWALPVLEAMASGTPVLTSDGGPLREVVGDSGEVVAFREEVLVRRRDDVDFEKDFAREMGVLLGSPSRRAELSSLGLARVSTFTWDRVARQTQEVYKELV